MSLRWKFTRPMLAIVLLCLGPLALRAQGIPASLRVEMVSSAQVSQAQVVLGEIAYLSSPDLQLLRRAMALPIGMAPRAGESTVLDRDRLANWVTTRLGVPVEKIQWEGVGATVVQSASRELAGETLVALAQPVLQNHLLAVIRAKGISDARVELNPVSVPLSVFVPLGDAEYRVRPLASVVPDKRMLVWIDIFAGQRHVKAIPVRFEVSVYADATVAAKPLRSGEAIGVQDTFREQIDVAHLLSRKGADMLAPLPLDQPALAPSHSRTAVRAGEVLTAERVRPAAAVSRGDRVTLVAHSGLVSLESKVEVLQAGEVGQVVRVRANNGTAPVMAKVMGPGQLELQQ